MNLPSEWIENKLKMVTHGGAAFGLILLPGGAVTRHLGHHVRDFQRAKAQPQSPASPEVSASPSILARLWVQGLQGATARHSLPAFGSGSQPNSKQNEPQEEVPDP